MQRNATTGNKTSTLIAYIFERHPVLTQTFLQREIRGLARQGLRIEIHSMLGSGNGNFSTTHEDVPVKYFRWWSAIGVVVALPRELFHDPLLLRDGWRLWIRHRPTNWENRLATLWGVIFALCRAQNIRRHPPNLLHATRATGPATAAAILSRLCKIPFSFGAHAYDIYRHDGDAFLEPKMQAARFVHTTTEAAATHLRSRCKGAPVTILLSRRGLEKLPEARECAKIGNSIRLLSVGRLVVKKGHTHQIAACSLLKSWGIPFEARIIGQGPLRHKLQEQIDHTGLGHALVLCGGLPPEQVDEEYARADIFWHTGIVDEEGDRDGLPNVIPEAFAHGLPVISNKLPATGEALVHNLNGLAVDVSNAKELAEAVRFLVENPGLRAQFGKQGRRWVENKFLISENSKALHRAFVNAAMKNSNAEAENYILRI